MNISTGVTPPEESVVLIVSAHEHLRDHYATILAPLGARLMSVSDAFEALALLRVETIHAIFSDLYLPGMDALGLFVFMKELHFSIPLVICTNDLSAKKRDEAIKAGVFRIIRKPTSTREIQAGIQLAIEERERQLLQFFC